MRHLEGAAVVLLSKKRAGSDSYGNVWPDDGAVIEVADEQAAVLLAIPDGGFSEAPVEEAAQPMLPSGGLIDMAALAQLKAHTDYVRLDPVEVPLPPERTEQTLHPAPVVEHDEPSAGSELEESPGGDQPGEQVAGTAPADESAGEKAPAKPPRKPSAARKPAANAKE
jgi:hypothetical protein